MKYTHKILLYNEETPDGELIKTILLAVRLFKGDALFIDEFKKIYDVNLVAVSDISETLYCYVSVRENGVSQNNDTIFINDKGEIVIN